MILFKRFARLALWLATLLVICGVGLMGVLWAQHNHAVLLPAPTGPFGVGRVEYDWVDESRIDTFASSAGLKRELPVWIWYPTDPTAQGEPAPYLPPAWLRAREQDTFAEALLAAFFTQNLAAVHGHSQNRVSVASQHPQYPVLVMQPGLGPLLSDYTALAEELASHGYIVVGSTPTYSASVVVFADGRVVHGTPAGNVSETASPKEAKRVLDELITVWTADDQFILNQLERLNAAGSDSMFAGRLDMQAVGVFGHSFGGATAAEVCRRDARCKAGIDLDGYPYGDVVQTSIDQPFMFVWSEPAANADEGWQQASRDTRAIYAGLSHGGYHLMIKGSRHFNFSDYALEWSPILKMQGGLGPIDGQRGLAIVEDYVLAFFDKYLKHSDAPLLAGPVSKYPEVQFDAR
jgi:predicted dienelactone hydrolase